MVSLAGCVNLTKPPAVEACANKKPTSDCANAGKTPDSGVHKDTAAPSPDTTVDPPKIDSGVLDLAVPDTQVMDTKLPIEPDVAVDMVIAPKPDTLPSTETAVPDPKPEATVEPPIVVVEPSTPDGSVPIDTKPPVETAPPDTLVPVDTTPPSPDTKITGSENCPITKVGSGTNPVVGSTTGGFCVVTCDDLSAPYSGWGCSNDGGRTVKINGKTMAKCGDPLPAKVNGYFVFEVSAGTNADISIYWWTSVRNPTCPLPDGGLLP